MWTKVHIEMHRTSGPILRPENLAQNPAAASRKTDIIAGYPVECLNIRKGRIFGLVSDIKRKGRLLDTGIRKCRKNGWMCSRQERVQMYVFSYFFLCARVPHKQLNNQLCSDPPPQKKIFSYIFFQFWFSRRANYFPPPPSLYLLLNSPL